KKGQIRWVNPPKPARGGGWVLGGSWAGSRVLAPPAAASELAIPNYSDYTAGSTWNDRVNCAGANRHCPAAGVVAMVPPRNRGCQRANRRWTRDPETPTRPRVRRLDRRPGGRRPGRRDRPNGGRPHRPHPK